MLPEAENRPQAAVLACRSASRRAPQLQVTHLIGFVTPHGLARVLRPCWCALVASVGKVSVFAQRAGALGR